MEGLNVQVFRDALNFITEEKAYFSCYAVAAALEIDKKYWSIGTVEEMIKHINLVEGNVPSYESPEFVNIDDLTGRAQDHPEMKEWGKRVAAKNASIGNYSCPHTPFDMAFDNTTDLRIKMLTEIINEL